MYRVAHLVANLGWVDLNFDYSTVCLILPGLMEFGRSGWAVGQDGGTPKSKSTEPRFATRWATLYKKDMEDPSRLKVFKTDGSPGFFRRRHLWTRC